MKRFTRLFRDLDESNRTRDKVAVLRTYFEEAPAADAVWVLWFLWGNRLNLKIPSRRLRQWAADLSGFPDWLVEACYERVGDLAETGALLLPLEPSEGAVPPLHEVIESHLLPLRYWDDRFQFQLLRDFWLSLDRNEVLVLNKMITGGFRIGVSRLLVVRALAEALGIERATLTHRLMGEWEPREAFFHSLTDPTANAEALITCPYPFYLASPITRDPADLGNLDDWIVEWKWDGIRAQLIYREGNCQIWSRGEERVTDAFPELAEAVKAFPEGTVLDGEILCWKGESPLGFHVLQRRLNRKSPDKEIMEAAPVVFMAYDCLEQNGKDTRDLPITRRKAILEALLENRENPLIRLSPVVCAPDWKALEEKWSQSRDAKVEGLMLKHRTSTYKVGRVRGEWWKWKVDPYTADLVMVYAQAGHGRRASLYTDYTLAASDGEKLVPVAKAYSGLTDAEIQKVDTWIKQNTLARRGPVRTVPAEQVFEIGFEGLRPSNRHKSGIAMRFPRILRWRRDKPVSEIDTVDSLRKLIE